MSYWMIGSEIFTDELLARKWLEQHPMNRGRLLFVEESELSAAREALASAVATHRAEMAAMVKQVNEALKVRDLAREASNRDLLAKRAAEQELANALLVVAASKASEDRAFGELVELRKVCQDALPLISGWREAIVLLEDFCGDSVRLRNMVAAADQLDDFKKALVLALTTSGK